MFIDQILSAYEKPLTVMDFEKLKDHPLIDKTTIGLQGSPTNILTSFTPVSYTHLDVYKRQEEYSAELGIQRQRKRSRPLCSSRKSDNERPAALKYRCGADQG